MDGQLPEEIKQKRLDELMTAQQTFSLERNRLRIGTEEKVLVETVDGKGRGVGRSAQEAPDTDGVIKLIGVSEADLGQFVRARITDAEVYDSIFRIVFRSCACVWCRYACCYCTCPVRPPAPRR